jgi:hypothetical protein
MSMFRLTVKLKLTDAHRYAVRFSSCGCIIRIYTIPTVHAALLVGRVNPAPATGPDASIDFCHSIGVGLWYDGDSICKMIEHGLQVYPT